MTPGNPSTQSDQKQTNTTHTTSPMKKKGRKAFDAQKLQFSPRMKTPNTNKVFVVGAKMGLILMRTQRQNNDAFTHTANLMIEDPETGTASRLNIIKICNRRQSSMIDKAIFQSSGYASLWYVTIIEDESKNTEEFRRDHAEEFIKFLNDTKWKYHQSFTFGGDETKTDDGKIVGTWDMYCLNIDIASVLKQFIFEDLGNFLEDEEALSAVFGPKCTSKQASTYLKDYWLTANFI
jgi:hypothetical protein